MQRLAHPKACTKPSRAELRPARLGRAPSAARAQTCAARCPAARCRASRWRSAAARAPRPPWLSPPPRPPPWRPGPPSSPPPLPPLHPAPAAGAGGVGGTAIHNCECNVGRAGIPSSVRGRVLHAGWGTPCSGLQPMALAAQHGQAAGALRAARCARCGGAAQGSAVRARAQPARRPCPSTAAVPPPPAMRPPSAAAPAGWCGSP